jgi:hypothetical protein
LGDNEQRLCLKRLDSELGSVKRYLVMKHQKQDA